MTDINKPVARPTETLVHLHFIDPRTNGRSTWIGTSVHRALLRDADGRLNLEVMIDVDAASTPAPQDSGRQEALAPHSAVFADEDDAVHLASGDRAECGAPGGGRASCLASVTCRDCLDAFHAPTAGNGAAR